MAKTKQLSVFEQGRLLSCLSHLSHLTIAAEVSRSKTLIINFIKDPDNSQTPKKFNGTEQKDPTGHGTILDPN